jgi:hypothetical protein
MCLESSSSAPNPKSQTEPLPSNQVLAERTSVSIVLRHLTAVPRLASVMRKHALYGQELSRNDLRY